MSEHDSQRPENEGFGAAEDFAKWQAELDSTPDPTGEVPAYEIVKSEENAVAEARKVLKDVPDTVGLDANNFGPNGAMREQNVARAEAMAHGRNAIHTESLEAQKALEELGPDGDPDKIASAENVVSWAAEVAPDYEEAHGVVYDIQRDPKQEKDLRALNHLARGERGIAEAMALHALPHIRQAELAAEQVKWAEGQGNQKQAESFRGNAHKYREAARIALGDAQSSMSFDERDPTKSRLNPARYTAKFGRSTRPDQTGEQETQAGRSPQEIDPAKAEAMERGRRYVGDRIKAARDEFDKQHGINPAANPEGSEMTPREAYVFTEANGLAYDMRKDADLRKRVAAQDHHTRGEIGAIEAMALNALPYIGKAERAEAKGQHGKAEKYQEAVYDAMGNTLMKSDLGGNKLYNKPWWKPW